MTIGGSIALIILGAILAFVFTVEMAVPSAWRITVMGTELSLVGILVIVIGVVGLIFGLMRRRTV